MEETAAAAAEKATSYSYWVREATGDAAPLPAPRKIDAADLAAKPAPTTLGSVWNKAGTWEEKNLNSWANGRIKDLLGSLDPLEFSTGKASVYEVSKCSGDAFLVTVRNKKRVGYTYELGLKFKGKQPLVLEFTSSHELSPAENWHSWEYSSGEWLIKEENKKVKGYLDIPEFSFGELEDLEVQISFTDIKDLSSDNKAQISKDLKSFLAPIREKLRKFEEELKDR
uniref:Activator of Hsp90 ATPase AHSA1-like N-terminal domain-containing protein n=2 Tax=Oryza TaxID=4527 RepID=A0A0E0Q2B5_ORYRU